MKICNYCLKIFKVYICIYLFMFTSKRWWQNCKTYIQMRTNVCMHVCRKTYFDMSIHTYVRMCVYIINYFRDALFTLDSNFNSKLKCLWIFLYTAIFTSVYCRISERFLVKLLACMIYSFENKQILHDAKC